MPVAPNAPNILIGRSLLRSPALHRDFHIQWQGQTSYSYPERSAVRSTPTAIDVRQQSQTKDMHAYLGEPLLLQISNNTLPNERRCPYDMQHLFVIVPKQGKLEPVLCRVKRDCSRTRGTVQAVRCFALDARKIDRIVERAYHPVVASTIGQ